MAEQNIAAKADAKVAAKGVAKPVEKAAAPQRVIEYPVATEKAVSGIESRNEITLVVMKNATKAQVRAEAEKSFGAKVLKVRTSIQMGRKKAVVKFARQGAASDVAAKLKII